MAYNAQKAKENKAKKMQAQIDEIENEVGGVAVAEPEKRTMGTKHKEANEFESDYTLEVDADYDPTADIFRIPKKDPSFEYRYLRDDPERLPRTLTSLLHQQGGWQLVPKAHLFKIGFKGRDISEDGFRRIGKHILAFMPMDYYRKKTAGKQQKTNLRTGEIRRNISDGIKRIGAEGVETRVRDNAQKDNKYYVPGDKQNSKHDLLD